MRTLAAPSRVSEIHRRLALLSPTDPPLWGLMTAHQMICHLTEAFRCALDERSVAPFNAFPLPRSIFKYVALYMPVHWPPGVPAPPEIRISESPPADFHTSRTTLLATIDSFLQSADLAPQHPMWGRMTRAQWLRWGYLHTDHHLRQFGHSGVAAGFSPQEASFQRKPGLLCPGLLLNSRPLAYGCRCNTCVAMSGQNSRNVFVSASRPIAHPNFSATVPAVRSELG